MRTNYTGKYSRIYWQFTDELEKWGNEMSDALNHANLSVLRYLLTTRRWNQLITEEITFDQARAFAFIRLEKQMEKANDEFIAALNWVELSTPATSVGIVIEWKKNRTWGNIPHAEVNIGHGVIYTGSASGYGYDKESAALAAAFNKSPEILRILYDEKEERLSKLGRRVSNDEALGYGVGNHARPEFQGGVGVNAFRDIFAACGYALTRHMDGEHFTTYTLTKEVT